MEGDIITFKEGISREVSCSASQSIPVADINIKVAGRQEIQINQNTEVIKSMKAILCQYFFGFHFCIKALYSKFHLVVYTSSE